ncbi:unnamed protein product [Urochloa humidicola]
MPIRGPPRWARKSNRPHAARGVNCSLARPPPVRRAPASRRRLPDEPQPPAPAAHEGSRGHAPPVPHASAAREEARNPTPLLRPVSLPPPSNLLPPPPPT